MVHLLFMRMIILAFAASLVACATVPPGEYDPVASPEWVDGPALLVLKRDAGMAGAGCEIQFWLDGRELVRLRPSQSVTVRLPPGEYILGAKPAGMCGGGLREALVVAQEGKPRAYRVGAGSSMDFFLLPTSPD